MKKTIKSAFFAFVILSVFGSAEEAFSQLLEPWQRDLRGSEGQIARGVMDGNLIESNYRNIGETSRYGDRPFGVWPRGSNNRHIDGIGLYIGAEVLGNRLAYPGFYPDATSDTLLNPFAHHFRPPHGVRAPQGAIWGWLPKPGFHNLRRIDPITGRNLPTPAISRDPNSWPDTWPDRLNNPDDPGWAGQWNGYFGRGVFQADWETYYVIDDFGDKEYNINPSTGQPNSPFGVFYPAPSDSTIGGMGITVAVRILQWANVLAEDAAFILYEITNTSDYYYGVDGGRGLYFMNLIDYGLGNNEDDGVGEFDPQFDLAFGWSLSGIGPDDTGRLYPLGYTGFAFLESPGNPFDGLDNDEDGIVDERRNSGPGILIEGRDNILAYAQANYDLTKFENTTEFQGYGPVTQQPAYLAGRWWTGDENMNWVGFTDLNENGVWDEGEPLNDDVGMDGIGPFDPGYRGPDTGEGDGIPTPGEPNFDALDIKESDQIGLRGFDLDTRPVYQNGENLRSDTWLWNRMINSEFRLGTKPQFFLADIEPYLLFMSGPVQLPPGNTEYFSLAWIFGQPPNQGGREDFYKNRITVQNIYNANYRFAQPPIPPTLTAIAGDGRVTLAWDSVSVRSFDRFTQEFDFEGYKVYKGTDPLLSDSRIITDINGAPTFYKPIAQFDLINEFSGPVPVLGNTASYDLGRNTGLQFYYVDNDVKNGVRYYYAVVAYDRGVYRADGSLEIDPQENTFNFSFDAFGSIRGTSNNAAMVIPRPPAAGYIAGGSNEDLTKVTSGVGTGSISVTVVDESSAMYDALYRLRFGSQTISPSEYVTRFYAIERTMFNEELQQTVTDTLASGPMVESTPYVDGFFIQISNDPIIEYNPNRTGWVGNYQSDNELFNPDPTRLEDLRTNWRVQARRDNTVSSEYIPDDFELRWYSQNVYLPPRFQAINYLRDSLNVQAVNLRTNQQATLLIVDRNGNGQFDEGDELIIAEQIQGQYRFRHRVTFTIPTGQQPIKPGDNEVIRISNFKPFATGDFFQFTLNKGRYDKDLAREQLDRIMVVPNPYIATSELEVRTISTRGERRIMFMNLPPVCVIRIYNVRGELINTINRDTSIENGIEYWDLRSRDRQDVAYGIYIYHVEVPDVGEKVGKFALIK